MSVNLEIEQFQPHIAALRLGYGHTIEEAEAVVQSGLQFIKQLPLVQSFRGELLCQQGQSAGEIHVLSIGHVLIYRLDQQSKKHSDQIASPFSVIGASTLHGRENYDYSAEVFTDTCLTRSIHRTDLGQIFKENPEVSLFLHVDHEVQLSEWNERFSMWRTMPVPQRLARVLIDILAIEDTLPLKYLTQETLAGLVGATRESVSKNLRKLSDKGVLRWQPHVGPESVNTGALERICTGELKL